MREVELNATPSITDAYLEALKEVNGKADRQRDAALPGDTARVIEHEEG